MFCLCLNCICIHSYTILLNMMAEQSWMMGDDELEGSNKVLKQPNKGKDIKIWDQLILWGQNPTLPYV